MTTPTTTSLSAFLLDRLSEDEASARYMGRGPWNAALRAVVELHVGDGAECNWCNDYSLRGASDECPTLRALATIWSAHEAFEEGWR